MIEVNQRKKHDPENSVYGDCWKACIASILEFPYECVPEFEEQKTPYEMEMAVKNWLMLYGLSVRRTTNKPEGYSIAVGKSPRFKNISHCCVAKNGEIIFDPHPDKTDLKKIQWYETLENINLANNPMPPATQSQKS